MKRAAAYATLPRTRPDWRPRPASPQIQPFKLGVFLLICAGTAAGALLWVGALGLSEPPRPAAAFFESTVGDLRKGDAVRFKGLQIGSVRAIRLARDHRSICVEMEIDPSFELRQDLIAEVAQVGLSGVQYLSLEQLDETPGLGPPRSPECRTPAIPSRKGGLERMQARLESLLGKLDRIHVDGRLQSQLEALLDKLDRTDLEGLVANLRDVLGNEDLETTLANLARLTSRMDATLAKLDAEKLGPRMKQSLRELSDTAKQLRQLSALLNEQLAPLPPDALKRLDSSLQEVLDKTLPLLRASNDDLPRLFSSLQQGMAEMHATFGELASLLRTMRQQPGRILARPSKNEPFDH